MICIHRALTAIYTLRPVWAAEREVRHTPVQPKDDEEISAPGALFTLIPATQLSLQREGKRVCLPGQAKTHAPAPSAASSCR